MTRAQLLAAGLILAAGLTVGEVIFGGGSEAVAQTRPVTVDLRDVELRGATVLFSPPDGGCLLSAMASHRAPAGELDVVAPAQEYPFGGARCDAIRAAAAKAAARDLKFTDAGTP